MELLAGSAIALVEAVLLLESDPVDESVISKITGLANEDVVNAIEQIREDCAGAGRGIEPIRSAGGWILAPKTSLWELLRERYGKKNESRLSRAAMQTLSIIAYSQPITRAEVEAIRGVAADTMIRLLLDRGFIQEVGKKESPGRPTQYGTTRNFLKYFRLGSISELPKLDALEHERFDEEMGFGKPATADCDQTEGVINGNE